MERIKSGWQIWAIRGFYGVLFVVAGIAKLLGDARPVEEMLRSIGIPVVLSIAVSMILPWFELAIGIWFFINWNQKIRNLIVCICLIVFILILITGMIYKRKVCGCFGGLVEENLGFAIARDIVLLGGTVFLLAAQAGPSIYTSEN